MLVFVYGSLKRGFGNHLLLENSKFVDFHVTQPLFTMRNLGAFPGVMVEGDTPISGELYNVSEEVFQRLDRLEGYPNFYTRQLIPSPYGPAWMYVLNEREQYREDPIVEGGVWE